MAGKYVLEMGACDVFIEGGKPMLENLIMAHLEGFKQHGQQVIVDTFDQSVFKEMAKMVAKDGWKIAGKRMLTKEEEQTRVASTPIIVYDRNESATVARAGMLVQNCNVEAADICVLLDSVEGIDMLRELNLSLERPISHLCVAQVYDHLFQEARLMVRQGKSLLEIQKQIDNLVSTHEHALALRKTFSDDHSSVRL